MVFAHEYRRVIKLPKLSHLSQENPLIEQACNIVAAGPGGSTLAQRPIVATMLEDQAWSYWDLPMVKSGLGQFSSHCMPFPVEVQSVVILPC